MTPRCDWFDLATLRRVVDGEVAVDPGVAFAEADDLALRAWSGNDPLARDTAERVLHALNLWHHFASPLQPASSAIWSTLVRRAVEAGSRAYTGPQTLTAAQMRDQLHALVEHAESVDHSFLDDICRAPTLDGLILFSKNWMTSAQGFGTQLVALAQRCGASARRVVLRNLLDELAGVTHEHMRVRFVNRLGLDYDPVRGLSSYEPGVRDDPELVTGSFALMNLRGALTARPTPEAALGSFFSIEASFMRVCRRMLVGLQMRGGFDSAALEIFSLHALADEDHANEWLELLEHEVRSPEARAEVVRGAAAQMHTRHLWFEDMRRRFE